MPGDQGEIPLSDDELLDLDIDGVESDSTKSTPAQIVGALLFLAAILVGVFFFWNYIEPDAVPQPKNPTFIDTIFASPAVVAAARIVLLSVAIVLLFGSIYVAASSVVRMQRRQWLRRAGPFESHLDEAKEELEELDPLLELYAESIEENEQLAERLTERDQQLEELAGLYDAALDFIREKGLAEDQ